MTPLVSQRTSTNPAAITAPTATKTINRCKELSSDAQDNTETKGA